MWKRRKRQQNPAERAAERARDDGPRRKPVDGVVAHAVAWGLDPKYLDDDDEQASPQADHARRTE